MISQPVHPEIRYRVLYFFTLQIIDENPQLAFLGTSVIWKALVITTIALIQYFVFNTFHGHSEFPDTFIIHSTAISLTGKCLSKFCSIFNVIRSARSLMIMRMINENKRQTFRHEILIQKFVGNYLQNPIVPE